MDPSSIISRLGALIGRPSPAGLAIVGVALHGFDAALAASGGSPAWRLTGALGWLCWAAAARTALGERARPGRAVPGARCLEAGEGARPGGSVPGEIDAAGPRVSRAVGWGGVLAVVAVGALWRQSGLGSSPGESDVQAAAALRVWPAWASAVVFALAPALGEEVFFRGAVLRALARRRSAWLAWAVSAGTFALVHPDHGAAAAIIGGALAGLALATGRSREAIVAHALHNLLGLRALTL